MNKNEYLSRVFESQINSLQREIEETEEQIDNLTEELNLAKLNLDETRKTLTYAKEEMYKTRTGDSYTSDPNLSNYLDDIEAKRCYKLD